MHINRLIPILRLNNESLVKTARFNNFSYIGDPCNTVRIFNEKLVDELIVLDIDATAKGKYPDLKMIDNLAVAIPTCCCKPGDIRIGYGLQSLAMQTPIKSISSIVETQTSYRRL